MGKILILEQGSVIDFWPDGTASEELVVLCRRSAAIG
jgi:hypothetical protein